MPLNRVLYLFTSRQCGNSLKIVNLPFKRFLNKNFPNLCKAEQELKTEPLIVQDKLRQLFEISQLKALELVTGHEELLKTPSSVLQANYQLCSANGLSHDLILRHIFLLTDQKLSEKIELMKKIPLELTVIIPLAKLSPSKLRRTTSGIAIERIKFLSEEFFISESTACEHLALKPLLLFTNIKTIITSLALYKRRGINTEEILNDAWILRYSKQFLNERFKLLEKLNITHIKTWMIRCPENTLHRHIKKELEYKDILGEASVAEYLSEKLQCNEYVAKQLIERQPAIQTKNVLKMSQMIEFLYQQGFTSKQICRNPKILLHSVETTKKRIKELSSVGKQGSCLYLLTRSQKQFIESIEYLKTKNESNNTKTSKTKKIIHTV